MEVENGFTFHRGPKDRPNKPIFIVRSMIADRWQLGTWFEFKNPQLSSFFWKSIHVFLGVRELCFCTNCIITSFCAKHSVPSSAQNQLCSSVRPFVRAPSENNHFLRRGYGPGDTSYVYR